MRRCAIVTGASRGIGRGIALCLAQAGYDLAITYRKEADKAQDLAEEIHAAYGRECFIFQASLEQRGIGEAVFDQMVASLGRLDLLVNNAGVTLRENLLEMSDQMLDTLIDLNFRNYVKLMQKAARYMVKTGTEGSIVNITSVRGHRAFPTDGIYGGIKAALNRAIQSFALDLAPYHIRVNNVAPGAIRVRTKEELAIERPGSDPAFWDTLGKKIPWGRSGTPEDIGKAVVFLASDAAEYITGVTLTVDGGLTLPGMPERPDPGSEDLGWGYVKKIDPHDL